ncbi:glucose-1-phosphate thymidylyltransferase RfbA [Glaciecola petra]|uniref:Glucose-1-phosphate thymidylyltransferase n=1 Tax=Glaciecola petra TaxID=3075602 RepID=A0ABU2ZLZ8_9ALTE|nr:glucose-1-phosphate thymidylyltransferase RfbA [Aestuariibacter sp. P117]MDT0593656.1 glucose-1-phosphate thymidylyltransferase RfbA [Aestuariibacter sp. P117]
MARKGIILAGGTGTRLHPLTQVVSKQLMPIYDKPMIYYPLSTLMITGITDILIITTPEDLPRFQALLGDGTKWGIQLEYVAQPTPDGLAQAFILGEEFIGNDTVTLVLGDNLLYGNELQHTLTTCAEKQKGATIFGYHVTDPERYGVVEFESNGKVLSIEEKPAKPKSNFAMAGLYFFDNKVVDLAKTIKPSKRGELEITDVVNLYLQEAELDVEIMGRGSAWLDTGTIDSLLDASNFIAVIEKRQGLKICCPEEIAYRKGFITKAQLIELAQPLIKSGYGKYLLKVANESK